MRLCLLVFPECVGVPALFSGLSGMLRCAHLAFGCVQTVAVSLPFFLVYVDGHKVSALFVGVSRMWLFICLPFWCPKCDGVSVLFFGVTKLSRFVRLIFWCVQTFASCPIVFWCV